jgi:radical SAM protein with 4Fe4S-binding SPASM domain
MPLVALDLLPQPRHWEAKCGTWRDNVHELDPTIEGYAPILVSPDFHLEADKLVTFSFSALFGGGANLLLHLVERPGGNMVYTRLYQSLDGDARLSIVFRPARTSLYRLVLEHMSHPRRARTMIAAPSILVQHVGEGEVRKGRLADFDAPANAGEEAPYLPHWNAFQRFIHRRCRASRRFNSVVAAVEMRLERQELLSLPQYMGLCPTGQCNALCDFCSVTINRTGIVKKQLPFDRLDRFLAPVTNTIQMYGIEGNGEPTLYTRFPELVERLSRGRGKAYLITNGSRLRPDDVPLLLALDSVNFSLNAATAETHRCVMKLKNFDEVIAIIRALVRQRGSPSLDWDPQPAVYTTFVVTDDNVHEAQGFVRLAEQELGVDVVMLRPLSELGNELGTVEDLRRIVPYESDVRDMIDAVQEYVHDLPGRTEIRLNPDTFRSTRPDPVGRVTMPRGYEGRLLAPRRAAWAGTHPDASIAWRLNSARITLPAAEGELLRSQPIPVEPNRELRFKAKIDVAGGPMRLLIVGEDGQKIAEATIADTGGRSLPLELIVQTGRAGPLSLVLAGSGRSAVVHIDFERLRTPAPYISNAFLIPSGRRWESFSQSAEIRWSGNVLSLNSPAGGRPYLIKSYAIPCARNATIEIPIEIDVRTGPIEVGVLDATGASYLATFAFAEGQTDSSIFFDTAANDAVRLVVSATPGRPVAASIRWLEPRLLGGEQAEGNAPRLPGAAEWAACVPGLRVDRSASELSLAWRGEGSPYLLKSNKVRCRSGHSQRLSVPIEVSEGRLGIGVLDGAGAAWLCTQTLGQGMHRAELGFATGANDGVHFVLFALDGAPVAARIGLSDQALAEGLPSVALTRGEMAQSAEAPIAVESGPDAKRLELSTGGPADAATPAALDLAEAAAPAEVAMIAAAESSVRQALPETAREPTPAPPIPSPDASEAQVAPPHDAEGDRLLRQIARWFSRGGVRFYCQKPWTDLNNFTVDGRMDVCCIATGASQERYQLGNLKRQSFQEIWNGPTAREFRRTVNGSNKLPPCARCPMSYAYQGFLFHPEHSCRVIANKLSGALRRLKLSFLSRPAQKLSAFMVDRFLFRGFKRERARMN